MKRLNIGHCFFQFLWVPDHLSELWILLILILLVLLRIDRHHGWVSNLCPLVLMTELVLLGKVGKLLHFPLVNMVRGTVIPVDVRTVVLSRVYRTRLHFP